MGAVAGEGRPASGLVFEGVEDDVAVDVGAVVVGAKPPVVAGVVGVGESGGGPIRGTGVTDGTDDGGGVPVGVKPAVHTRAWRPFDIIEWGPGSGRRRRALPGEQPGQRDRGRGAAPHYNRTVREMPYANISWVVSAVVGGCATVVAVASAVTPVPSGGRGFRTCVQMPGEIPASSCE